MIIRDLPHCPAGNHRKHWSLLALIGCCAGLGCNSSTSNPGASLRTVTFPSASSEQWAKQSLIATSSTGTATQDDTTNLSLSPQGNIIALGRVIPTPSSLSTTPPTQEQEFLTSYDANGNQVNTTSFSQGILPDTDVLAVGTPDGNYVATANPETIGNIPWLLPLNLEKFSSTGAALWTATLPTTGQYAQLVLSGIVADRSGNVYVSGTTGGAVNGLWGIFFAKFDGDSGALLWQHNYIAVGNLTQLTNLATDPDGNLYVTGMGIGNFITPQQSPSMQDSFLTKLDSNTGNTIWSISAPSGISYTSVAVSSNGNGYIIGHLQNSARVGFIAAFSPQSGTSLWQKQLADATLLPTNVTTDVNGDAVFTGVVQGAQFLNPASDSADLFLAKIDSAGTGLWSQIFGTGQEERAGYSSSTAPPPYVVTDGQTGIYVAGVTLGAFPGFQNPAGLDELYLAKFTNQ